MKSLLCMMILLLQNYGLAQEKYKESIIFQKVLDGEIIFQKDVDILLTPASLSKLPLTHLALKTFGPEHQIETAFYYTGKLKDERITGDLIIEASGDPMLINEKIWEVAARIKATGIKQFDGNLIIEEKNFSIFQSKTKSEKEKSNSRNAYDALITGFSVNFNVFPIWAQRIDNIDHVSTIPTNIPKVILKNNIKSGKYRSKIKAERHYSKGTNYISVNGVLKNNSYKDTYVSTGNPSLTSAYTFKAMLQDLGINVLGTVKILQDYKSKKSPLYKLKGYKIKRAIEGINKYSNNFMADMLLVKMAADKNSKGNLFTAGSKILTEHMKIVSKNKNVLLTNGSGLSTSNRFSVRDLE